jgi:hypothetical protein
LLKIELSSDLHFPEDILRKLVFEAQVRGTHFGELVGTLITAAIERDLLRQASYTEHGCF